MALKMKTCKVVKIRPIPDALPDEKIARDCDCCGSKVPYGQKLEMTRCNMRDSYLNTNVFLCLECSGGKTDAEISVLAMKAMDIRIKFIENAGK